MSEAAPHGVKHKAPGASPGGEVRSGAVLPMEEDTPTPVAEATCYDSQPDIDEDYRYFLRHTRVVNDKLVFKTENCKITIGDDSDAEEEDDTEEEEEEEGEGQEDHEEEEDGEEDDTEEEEQEEEEEGQEDDEEEEDGLPASGQSGEDSIGTKEAIPALETEDGVDSDLPFLKVKDEEVSKEEEDDVGPKSDSQSVNGPVYYESKEEENDVGPKSDSQSVNGPVYYETKVKEEGENTLNALARGTTDLDPSDKKEASSSKGHLAMPLIASELQGVIWPPHINERPNSVFKEKLIEFLIKPFTHEEYDRYFALATNRAPMVKEQRTRNKVACYHWTHEMSKSYFDWYPDLAEQFSLQGNNHPNGLALLRGLFFWLQNIEQEGQFRPWSDEFKKYRVVLFVD